MDPPRSSSVAVWRAEGEAPPSVASGSLDDLSVALPADKGVELATVPAVLLPVRAAPPVLTRTRATGQAHRASAFRGAASMPARLADDMRPGKAIAPISPAKSAC